MRSISGLVVALVAGVAIAGCSSDTPRGGEKPTNSPTVSKAPRPDLGEFRVADMLAQVPELVRTPGEPFVILLGDLTEASKIGGLERPTDAAEAGAWTPQLSGVGTGDGEPSKVFVPLDVPLAGTSPAPLVEEELGWSVTDVDRFVTYSIGVNAHTMIAEGTFEADTLAHLPEGPQGIRSAGEGPDLSDGLENATPARPQGVPLRMAVQDRRLAVSTYTEVVEEWLAGPQSSLSEDPVLSQLASALDEQGMYAARIATPLRQSAIGGLPNWLLEEIAQQPPMRFDAYAVGWGTDGTRPKITIAYHPQRGESVQALRAAVDARWHGRIGNGRVASDVIRLDEVEVSDGLVVATMNTLPGTGADFIVGMLERNDPQFLTS